jgi:hypothetical protein
MAQAVSWVFLSPSWNALNTSTDSLCQLSTMDFEFDWVTRCTSNHDA